MIKPLAFDQYWANLISEMDKDVISAKIFPYLKGITENTWNAALREAVLVCNNMEETYEESAVIDKDVIVEIAAIIESLRK